MLKLEVIAVGIAWWLAIHLFNHRYERKQEFLSRSVLGVLLLVEALQGQDGLIILVD